jgi:hypothetical protein
MAQTKKLDQERWSEFLSMFSNGNRGRMVAIEVADMAIGDQPLTDGAPLFAIDYDPANKGDDLVITTGRDEVGYTHKISAPAEIWELQDDNGKAVSLEVIDRNGAKTILVFKG